MHEAGKSRMRMCRCPILIKPDSGLQGGTEDNVPSVEDSTDIQYCMYAAPQAEKVTDFFFVAWMWMDCIFQHENTSRIRWCRCGMHASVNAY